MKRFTAAERGALARLNLADPLPLPQWVHEVQQARQALARLGLASAAIAEVAIRADALRLDPSAPGVSLFSAVEAGAGDERDLAQCRRTLAFLTHSASRGELTRDQAVLLAGSETVLLDAGRPGGIAGLDGDLQRWRELVGQLDRRADGGLAAGVASVHHRLAAIALRDLNRVRMAAGSPVSAEQLRARVTDTMLAWARARDAWLTDGDGQQHQILPRETSEPLARVRRSLLGRFGGRSLRPEHDLTGLLESDLAGQSLTAEILARSFPEDQPVAAVLAATANMRQVWTALSADRANRGLAISSPRGASSPIFLGRRPPAPPVPELSPPTPQPVIRASVPAKAPETGTLHRGGAVDVGEVAPLTWDESVELAARRDAGVAAEAAIAGDPVAGGLLGDATPRELQQLVDDGIRARAVLVASVKPMAYAVAMQHGPGNFDELAQEGLLAAMGAADRWDPRRGVQWAGYAWSTLRWSNVKTREREATQPTPIGSEVIDQLAPPPPGADQDVIEKETERQRDSAVIRAIARLPAELREVMEMQLGENPPSVAQMSRQLGIVPSTVRRRLEKATTSLRADLEGLPEGNDPTQSRRAESRDNETGSNDRPVPDPHQRYQIGAELAAAIARLPAGDQEVLGRHFGSDPPLSNRQMGLDLVQVVRVDVRLERTEIGIPLILELLNGIDASVFGDMSTFFVVLWAGVEIGLMCRDCTESRIYCISGCAGDRLRQNQAHIAQECLGLVALHSDVAVEVLMGDLGLVVSQFVDVADREVPVIKHREELAGCGQLLLENELALLQS